MASATRAPAKDSAAGLFVDRVKALTGLNSNVIATWIIAEHSTTPNNPLNVMDPRTKRPIPYSTPEAGAQATATLIRTRYPHILTAAKTGGPKEQLDAITASAWDSCRYRGLKTDGTCASVAPGALLYGVWTTLVGGPPLAGQRGSGAYAADPFSVGGAAGKALGVADALGVGGLGVDSQGNTPAQYSGAGAEIASAKTWLADKALVALLYFGLTGLALALLVLGLARATGISVGGIARTPMPTPKEHDQGSIPF